MDPILQAVLAALASFAFITILLALLMVLWRRRSGTTTAPPLPTRRHPRLAGGSRTLPEPDPAIPRCVDVYESATFDPSLSEISMAELSAATKNFSSDLIVGDGSFGLVYRAQLSNGVVVAVKKLDHDALQGFREFRAEMETLGRLRHPNIVKILGYCVSGPDRVLIYEFMERGSLDNWLHDTAADNADETAASGSLAWRTRLTIARGVAEGLAYLHGLEKPIIHRDIKASNVLLDSDFEAHIADFGLARRMDASRSHVSTQVAGTMGYMPPEYREGNTAATAMADAYSFGILMVEIATRKRPNLPVMLDGKEVGLAQWAAAMVGRDREAEMVDEYLKEEWAGEGPRMKEYFRIACMCLSEGRRERPKMAQVVDMLRRV